MLEPSDRPASRKRLRRSPSRLEIGRTIGIDYGLVIPDPSRTLAAGAVEAGGLGVGVGFLELGESPAEGAVRVFFGSAAGAGAQLESTHPSESIMPREPSAVKDATTTARLGVLVANLGTPDAPTPEAIKRYLGEFLADPMVIDLPRWFWLPLLRLQGRESLARAARMRSLSSSFTCGQ